MGIPSDGTTRRGQQDTIGYASRADQMAKVWEASASPPRPDRLGEAPSAGIAGAIAPHDDYVYAGRLYREVLPLITAPTVVIVGVFHKYRRFDIRNQLVFDSYSAWRTPDGDGKVSPLREEILGKMPAGSYVQSAPAHDSEHSVEALVYWLKHARPDVQILPIIVPASPFDRLQELAGLAGKALSETMAKRGWVLGRDVAVVISADAVHYGADFQHVPFGEGGVDAYQQAVARDKSLLMGPLNGDVTVDKAKQLYATFVDPDHPDTYRVTWCGRFSIPLGLMLLDAAARASAGAKLSSRPVAYGTSVGWPELPLRDAGLAQTAPANLFHFVGHPAVALTITR
ncbi:MAG: AmmeMemoRadiSam system protein B [Deltaproteobacteria bacterium]|nr:AmmeMemoRadiSam system protein B [Deltaproteobacteria bacterium]